MVIAEWYSGERVLSPNPLIPETHMVEGKKSPCKKSSDHLMFTVP